MLRKFVVAATLSLACVAPVDATYVTLTGAGGVSIGAGPLTPPSITPQISSAFDQAAALGGGANNTLFVPTGASYVPATVANSHFQLFEATVDNNLDTGYQVNEQLLGGNQALLLTSNDGGSPTFFNQYTIFGTPFHWFNDIPGVDLISSTFVSVPSSGTGYNNGFFQWTGSGGGCTQEPSGYFGTTAFSTALPGKGCVWPTPVVIPALVPGYGAQQATIPATSCVSNSPISGEMTVTATVAIAHGVVGGQTYTLQGLTPSGFNATYTALAGTNGTTLIGETTTGGGTCPASTASAEGTALGGSGNTVLLPSLVNSPGTGSTGITTKSNQKICGVTGEYGLDSPTPGVPFIRILDGKTGLDLYGSPNVGTILNQGASNFTGYTTAGGEDTNATFTASISTAGVMNVTAITGTPLAVGQTITGPSLPPTTIASLGTGTGGTGTYNLTTAPAAALPSSTLYTYHIYAPALTVTALNYYTISNAVWASTGNGQVTFTTTAAHGLVPGSIFDVGVTSAGGSNVSPAGYNGRYIAISGTTGSTLVGVSYPVATLANPGSYVSGGSEASEVMPNALLLGAASESTISPFGTYNSTGTGLLGTYALSGTQTGWNITAGISGTVLTVSANSGYSTYQNLTAGVRLSTTGGVSSGTMITSLGSGLGNTGTYNINNSQTVTAGTTMTTTGALWSSGSPGNLYASPIFYWFPLPSTAAGGGSTSGTGSPKTGAQLANLTEWLGSGSAAAGVNHQQWGGSIANYGMHYGVFPQDSNGNPSLTALQSLCNKTTDERTFDIANGITTNALYRLNDPGVWGDSSNATITGYLSAASGTSGGSATLNVSSIIVGSLTTATGTQTAYLSAPQGGIVGGQSNVPSMSLTTSTCTSVPCTITITFGSGATSTNLASSGSPVTLNVGKWKPLAVTENALVNGYITTSGGSGPCATAACLHVTGYQTSALYWAGTASYGGGNGVSGGTGTLTFNSTTAGAGAINQLCFDSTPTDILGPPIYIASGSGTTWGTGGNYTPAFTSDPNVYCTASAVTTSQTVIAGANNPYPVQVVDFANGSQGGLGDYVVAFPPGVTPANVGSSGSPVALTLTGIIGGNATSPGPALTIADHGAGTTYALNNFPSASPTGSIPLAGTYNTTSLGGTPSAIQAQLSLTPGGTAVSGFSWANLSGGVVSGGNWSGTITGVPPGQYYVQVRAANGTAYANLPNVIRVGATFTNTGEGNYGACFGSSAGSAEGPSGGNIFYSHVPVGDIFGPPIVNDLKQGWAQAGIVNRYGSTTIWGECISNIAQAIFNETGWPVGMIDAIQAGVGFGINLWGYEPQTQTLGIGDGSSTEWCSGSTLCANDTSSLLTYNAANLTGAKITGSISTSGGVSTLNVSAISESSAIGNGGAISPGLVLSGAGVTGSPTIVACTVVSSSSCNFNYSTSGTAVGSNWLLSSNQGSISSQSFTLTPAAGAAFPDARWQGGAGPPITGSGSSGASTAILAGTFSVSVNGTQVCSDTASFSYSAAGGTCTGAGIASSFINYATGAYSISFTSAPASGAAINATWTNIVSSDYTGLPEPTDHVGTGATLTNGSTIGIWSSALVDKFPGGASAHIFGGGPSDYGPIAYGGVGYPLWSVGYTEEQAWFYNVHLPAIIPAQHPAPILVATNWKTEGPTAVANVTYMTESAGIDQWVHDSTSSSHFSGYVTAGSPATLTLTSAATGAMWEGEQLGCNPYSATCAIPAGVVITKLVSGSWGASGSVYDLAQGQGPSLPSITISTYGSSGSPVAMLNRAYFGDVPASQGEPAYLVGPFLDDAVLFEGVGVGTGAHPITGFTGGRRIGTRIGVTAAAYLSGGAAQTAAAPATLSRPTITACDTSAIAAPCFDIGTTYQASASLTWTGSTFTCTACLSANARPFVDGQALSCSGCNTGLTIVSVSAAPTQSTTSGAGQIGTTFTITASGAIGGSGSGTVTAGCSGTAGTGSNCIDVAIQNNVTGTYSGVARGIGVCGVNNIQGTTTQYTTTGPNGKCVDSGIGSLIRDFRIGPVQWMGPGDTSLTSTGNVYDDGMDVLSGKFLQGSAFTCNLVANLSGGIGVVQCVKAPARTLGVPSGIGQWSSGSTYIEYGDLQAGLGRAGSIMGNVGGQSFAFTAGSGYTNNSSVAWTGTAVSGGCPAPGGTFPKIDVWVSGGAIVDVYPAGGSFAIGNGVNSTCAFPAISNANYPGIGSGTSGAITTLVNTPLDGQYGVESQTNDNNMLGEVMYSNDGETSNPNASVFAAPGAGTYFEPGQIVVPWGQYYGAAVSG